MSAWSSIGIHTVQMNADFLQLTSLSHALIKHSVMKSYLFSTRYNAEKQQIEYCQLSNMDERCILYIVRYK